MPAVSQKQRVAIAIAEKSPGELYKRNASLLSMKPSDQHDFAATPTDGLPKAKRKRQYYGEIA